MRAFSRLEISGEHVAITRHATCRWRERRRPDSSLYTASRQLQTAIRTQGRLRRTAPPGFFAHGLKHAILTEAWIVFVDDRWVVALPLTNLGGELVATTCLIRRNTPP